MIVLNNDQQDKLVEQFVELQVDSMDMESLIEWVTDELILKYEKLTKEELKERIDCYQDDLFDELVDNVTNEIDQPKVTITPQELEGDISTITDDDYDTFSDKVVTCEELEKQSIKDYDDDYADKVDTLVGNMVASDDNVFTHDSEGC